MFVVYLQCPSCFPQPSSHCSHWSGEEGGGGGGTSTATDEWRHRDDPGPVGEWLFNVPCGNFWCKKMFSWFA